MADGTSNVILDRVGDLIGMLGENVISAVKNAVIDLNALLGIKLFNQLADGGFGDELVSIAVDHEATARARSEEAEIVMAGRRGNADPAGNLGAAHEELHADKGPKGIASDPEATVAGVDSLHPVERGGGVRDFAYPAIIPALTAADAAKVETHDRQSEALKRLVRGEDDAVVHCSAVQRMRMKQEGNGCASLL